MEMLGLLLWAASGLGSLASLALHINSYLQLFDASQQLAIALVFGMFVVFAPWLYLVIETAPEHKLIDAFSNVVEGYPSWVQIAAIVLYTYILVSAPVTAMLLDPNQPYVMTRLISGHCLVFYGAPFAELNARVMRRVN